MLLDFYRARMKQQFMIELQYRGEMVIWAFSGILEPLVFLLVWVNVAGSSGGDVGGWGAPAFAAYFIAAMLVHHVTFSWHMWEYAFRIKQGQVSTALLRPVHPIHGDVAENLSYKLHSLVIQLPAAALLIWLFRPAWDPQPWALAALVPAMLMAAAIRFLFDWTVALAAFWFTQVDALNNLYYVAVFFLSGRLAPLNLFPDWVQTVATVLPFRWVVAFPVELALGRLSPEQALWGLAAQAFWVPASYWLMQRVWRSAIRQYSAVGL